MKLLLLIENAKNRWDGGKFAVCMKTAVREKGCIGYLFECLFIGKDVLLSVLFVMYCL